MAGMKRPPGRSYVLPSGVRRRYDQGGERATAERDGTVRRNRRLNPYRPATDTGLLTILGLVAAVILIVISGAFDCRFQFSYVGFC